MPLRIECFFVSLESESELKQLTKYRDLMMSFFKEIFKSDIRKMSSMDTYEKVVIYWYPERFLKYPPQTTSEK